ncbi:TPA: hypothetical protein ACH3X1_015330 [Trebouxia sp. C0004]
MEVRPNGRKEAIGFVWNQPDAALTLSQKQSITAALAKDTDETASLYFLAPVLEQWVGTLKELLEPTDQIQRLQLQQYRSKAQYHRDQFQAQRSTTAAADIGKLLRSSLAWNDSNRPSYLYGMLDVNDSMVTELI